MSTRSPRRFVRRLILAATALVGLAVTGVAVQAHAGGGVVDLAVRVTSRDVGNASGDHVARRYQLSVVNQGTVASPGFRLRLSTSQASVIRLRAADYRFDQPGTTAWSAATACSHEVNTTLPVGAAGRTMAVEVVGAPGIALRFEVFPPDGFTERTPANNRAAETTPSTADLFIRLADPGLFGRFFLGVTNNGPAAIARFRVLVESDNPDSTISIIASPNPGGGEGSTCTGADSCQYTYVSGSTPLLIGDRATAGLMIRVNAPRRPLVTITVTPVAFTDPDGAVFELRPR